MKRSSINFRHDAFVWTEVDFSLHSLAVSISHCREQNAATPFRRRQGRGQRLVPEVQCREHLCAIQRPYVHKQVPVSRNWAVSSQHQRLTRTSQRDQPSVKVEKRSRL